jgi:23S rRNA pseudouridine1911/1915/1917 synthase
MLKFIPNKTERLDKFLASQITAVSRGRIQKAIKDGLVLVNSKKVIETDFQLKENDSIDLPEFVKEELKASNVELKVVYENEDLAVIDKPAGMVVHPGAGNNEDTLTQALLSRYPGIETVGDPHRPGIVHRLDEDTSGLILIAKNQKSLEFFKQKFQDHNIEKEYLALVHGVPAKKHEIINLPLEKVPMKQKMSVRDGSAVGGKVKEAITEYWVLDSSRPSKMGEARPIFNGAAGQYSLIRVKLHTGRTHQIRAHLAHIGHPIFGDQVYGKEFKVADHVVLNRQFLHAYKLKFQMMDETWLELESELPPELRKVLGQLEISN